VIPKRPETASASLRVSRGARERGNVRREPPPAGVKKRVASTGTGFGFSIWTSVRKSSPPAPVTCPATGTMTARCPDEGVGAGVGGNGVRVGGGVEVGGEVRVGVGVVVPVGTGGPPGEAVRVGVSPPGVGVAPPVGGVRVGVRLGVGVRVGVGVGVRVRVGVRVAVGVEVAGPPLQELSPSP
jgi:hypothetical protein